MVAYDAPTNIPAELSMASRKQFEHDPVTHAAAHYLVAIAELHEEYGYARVSDIARAMDITRGSASITLKGLKQKGLVLEDDRKFLRLSETGQRVADSVRAKKDMLQDLFVRLLGVSEKQAESDTCQIEHVISAETASKIARLLQYMDRDNKTVRAFLRGARAGGTAR